ncbi:hypothetical protein EDC05_000842 [Coemansia umbellata]|uniref:Uncharacterized protein n=1 Tax=Coemansia umbellata TaxID=1424467 RepID=A0ABQ8PUX0_9FUNG|nr:hypothetical protein EDC05_000842 [Coemansia umbellata]
MSNWSAPIMNRCHEPTQGKDMRTMLRRHGFQVYLLDKNRTSNACPSCYDGELNTFKKDRDLATVLDFRHILTSLRENGETPERFRRTRTAAWATDKQQLVKHRRKARKQK